MDIEKILGDNSLKDVTWLCSLSESELDFILSLKEMAIQRAKVIGQHNLANKFDLKLLRVLGFILMERVKERIKDLDIVPSLDESNFLEKLNLLNCKLEDYIGTMSSAELKASIGHHMKKRTGKK
ncbi:hypothetical protein RJ641_026233 [Dillenia turbinata]|uniref:Uncharacterized protein n=1 Tax=Dillenia turbinata TaxID=194707 RepID=A0AAN8WBZ0_9MAGN